MAARRSAILTYHSLDTSGSVISVPPNLFRQQMQTLGSRGAPVVGLADAVRTPGALALTFDDGFENFYVHAFPVLQELRFPATVFVVSGHCGGWNDWPALGRLVPRLPLMSWERLREIHRAGIELGVHTANHADLASLPEAGAIDEMQSCRDEIEDRVGAPVRLLAYPYGRTNARVRAAAKARFSHALGTRLALVAADAPVDDLPRVDVYYLRGQWFERLVQGRGRAYLAARRMLRELRACVSR